MPDRLSEKVEILPSPGYPNRSISDEYRRRIRLKWLGFWALLIGMLFIALFAACQGAYDLTPARVLAALMGREDGPAGVVIMNIRLPRIVAAMVTGWGLALSGLALQSLLGNPLSSPSTLGISQGAAFGAAAAVVIFGTRMFFVTLSAFSGAMAAACIILVLARLKRLTPEAIILSGVALSSLFTSATILIQYLATETQLAAVVFWTFGDVARSAWWEIAIMTGTVALTTVHLMALRWDLNALDSGEEAARGLGVSVERIRLWGIMAAALVAALATAFHGVIAFVGLIAPHTARRLVGADHCLVVPFSSILGALLLLAADTAGRMLVGSGSLPVGVITSFMGAPLFLYLLVRGYR